MLTTMLDWYIKQPLHVGKYKVLRALFALFDGSVLRSRYGPWIRLKAADYTNRVAISGCGPGVADYDDVFGEVSSLKPGMAFVDVGANIGLFSLVASERVGSTGVVLAFEPSFPLFKGLVENADLNRVRNLYPFNAAMGSSVGIVRFSAGKENHSGVGRLNPEGDSSVLQVDLSSMLTVVDAVIGDREITIKIDVEGAECIVVQSMQQLIVRPQVRTIIVEINATHLAKFGAKAEQIYESMASAGYAPRRGLGAAKHYNEIFDRC